MSSPRVLFLVVVVVVVLGGFFFFVEKLAQHTTEQQHKFLCVFFLRPGEEESARVPPNRLGFNSRPNSLETSWLWCLCVCVGCCCEADIILDVVSFVVSF